MKVLLSIDAMESASVEMTALDEAKQLAGGPTGLSEKIVALGGWVKPVSPQAISQWSQCPPGRVLQVERVTGVSRYRLRPDIYGADPSELSEVGV